MSVFDHVAIATDDRAGLVAAVLDVLPWMRPVQQTDRLTLLGTGPLGGKLTVLDAPEPQVGEQQRGSVRQAQIVALMVDGRLAGPIVVSGLAITPTRSPEAGSPQGIVGVTVAVSDPPIAAAEIAELTSGTIGTLRRDAATIKVGVTTLTFVRLSESSHADASLGVDHFGVLVPDLGDALALREAAGDVVQSRMDAQNSSAAFFAGPDGMRVELIQHADSFAQM